MCHELGGREDLQPALSRLRGRAEVLEEAIASRDGRLKLRTYLELMAVAEEIGTLILRNPS